MDTKLAILEDGSYRVFYMNPNESEEIKERKIRKSLSFEGLQFKKIITTADLPPIGYQGCLKFKGNDFSLDRERVLLAKESRVRQIRNKLLSDLDLPFQLAIEKKDEEEQVRLSKKKRFLRDLPENLSFSGVSSEEIIKFDPFNNIFNIKVEHGGMGIKNTPRLRVDKQIDGRDAVLKVIMQGGKILRVDVIDYGCGYSSNEIEVEAIKIQCKERPILTVERFNLTQESVIQVKA